MKKRKDLSVLVTGAAGLQGYHLIRELIDQPNVAQVVGVDDLSRVFMQNPWEWASNLHNKFAFEERRYQSLTTSELAEFDSIIHLAASVSVPESMESLEKEMEYWNNNANDNLEFLQKLRLIPQSKWPVLVYASTSETFGDPEVTPMPHNHSQKPQSIYAAAKLGAEAQIMAYANWHKYPGVVVRTFNTYGPNQNSAYTDAAVIALFIKQALKGDPLNIHGNGSQTRDFQYAGDAVQAYKLLALNGLEEGSENYKYRDQQYNTGTGVQTTIKDLAHKIIKITGSSSEIIYSKARKGDIKAMAADYGKIKDEVGWEPTYSLDKGLIHTIDWYREQYIKQGVLSMSNKPEHTKIEI